MTDPVTIGVHEATPSGAPRAVETKLDARTAVDVRGTVATMLHLGRDYTDCLNVKRYDGNMSQVFTADDDAQTLYDAAKLARTLDQHMIVYDKSGKAVGELDPDEVMKRMTQWHNSVKQ